MFLVCSIKSIFLIFSISNKKLLNQKMICNRSFLEVTSYTVNGIMYDKAKYIYVVPIVLY